MSQTIPYICFVQQFLAITFGNYTELITLDSKALIIL